jgi:hypothetical protein
MRRLALLLALFASTPAAAVPPAEPCPSIDAGWTIQFPNQIVSFSTISSVGYDQAAQMLYVASGSVIMMFAGVPFGVIQAFRATRDPVALYNSAVLPSYHALFLFEKNNCPLHLEGGVGGYLWSD